jgi:paraquat-inducible protein B
MNRLSSLPIEELMTTVTTLVGNVNALVTSPEVRSAPENVGALIADIREVVETSGIKDTPAQIAATLASIQSVVSDLETRKVMASLADTLETTRVTIEKFGVVADGVPRLVDETATLADRVNALPLDEFIASATRTVDGIDALVRSDSASALPGSVDATLNEARGLIADLRQGGAIENASATLASLKELTDQLKAADLGAQISRATAAAERATVNVDAATKGLPELMENLRALSARVNELPLDQLVTSADTVLRSADALLGAEGMDKVPTELAASLAEVRAMVTDLREGGAVTNLNSALASADEAAAAITAASANLPQLIASINAATARADLALSTFEPGSQINRETQNLLRDLRTAAQSVNALVTALERKPNSVLFGR